MGKPHKHADIIKAWADGAQIQFKQPDDSDQYWDDVRGRPGWYEGLEYRIKPEPKPDLIRYAPFHYHITYFNHYTCVGTDNEYYIDSLYADGDVVASDLSETWLKFIFKHDGHDYQVHSVEVVSNGK